MVLEEVGRNLEGEDRNYDNFPSGMRVLAVDGDPVCLKVLECLLRKCGYQVTTRSQATMALKMLRENKDRFDLVISDVHLPDMDGFKFLELIGLEMDLPVIMLSANSDTKLVMRGITHGACDYLVKPVRIKELRNIWQHVIRREKFHWKTQSESAPNLQILDRSEMNLQFQLSNSGQDTDQAFAFDIDSLWTMEQGGSKLVSTHENEITQQYQQTREQQSDELGAQSASGLEELKMSCTSSDTQKVNGCAEQNVGVVPPPGSETSLFGARIGSSQVRGVRQPDSPSQQPVKEDDIAKENVGARSPPRIGSSEIIARHADQSSEQSINETDRGNFVSRELYEATGSRKQGKVRTLDTEYGISREVLERHSGKKLKDVAVILGVSRSTLKRICRKHNIFRWPPSKAKRHNHQEFVQATHASIEESSQRTQPISALPPENESTSEVQTTLSAKPLQDDGSIIVKATYGDDIIKFPLLVSSRKLDLEKAVAMRLNLSIGSFKIKYLDEDDDWVLITCDADLRTCISTLSAKTTIKMWIGQSPSNDPKSS